MQIKMLTKHLIILIGLLMVIITTQTQTAFGQSDAKPIRSPQVVECDAGKVCVEQIELDTAARCYDEVVALREAIKALQTAREADAKLLQAKDDQIRARDELLLKFVTELVRNPPKQIRKVCIIC